MTEMAAAERVGPVRGRSMEGVVAAWYARATRAYTADFERTAERFAARMQAGAKVLEVAPGPATWRSHSRLPWRGDGAVEAIDISNGFVRIATRNAARAGVAVTFRHGDVHAMPYPAGQFDGLVCRAAFKNFGQPVQALREIRRVLRPGGTALIIDLRADATDAEIDDSVAAGGQGWLTSMIVGRTLKGMPPRRAYTAGRFGGMAAMAGFAGCEISSESIAFNAWLTA
jgi:ubiquinone/menaquinone biosynthesis C-methylase UbiE